MPRKIRQLIRDLEQAGFVKKARKGGSHRKFTHPQVTKPVILSGNSGSDAKQYQEKAVRLAIEESQK